MNKENLGQKIYNATHLTGEFKLRSGTTSAEYFDKYQFESDPNILRAIIELMTPLLPSDIDVLAGLEMGGIPIATALSLHTGIPQVLVRKEAKKYGTQKLAEGIDVNGKKLIVIEDIVTTAGQIIKSSQELLNIGANIKHALCVIEREGEGRKNLQNNNLELISLFTQEELNKYK